CRPSRAALRRAPRGHAQTPQCRSCRRLTAAPASRSPGRHARAAGPAAANAASVGVVMRAPPGRPKARVAPPPGAAQRRMPQAWGSSYQLVLGELGAQRVAIEPEHLGRLRLIAV